MNRINLPKEILESLNKLSIDSSVSNSESILFNIKDGKKLYKHFLVDEKEEEAKKEILIELDKIFKKYPFKEILEPIDLIYIDKKFSGYTMKKIENSFPLNLFLINDSIDLKTKLFVLYKIGILLQQINALKNDGITLVIGDLNEYNILVDSNLNIYIVDIDSFKTQIDIPCSSYYLYANNNLKYYPKKYKCNVFGINLSNYDNDILCYINIILNFISGCKLESLSIKEYNEYLDYLYEIGYGKKIINAFKSIYSNSPNLNPVNYFNEIPIDKIEISKYSYFINKKRNGYVIK